MTRNAKIIFRKSFDDFLGTLNVDRKDVIIKSIQDYALSKKVMPSPRDCHNTENRKKIAIVDASVVVFYDDYGGIWEFIDGDTFHERVA